MEKSMSKFRDINDDKIEKLFSHFTGLEKKLYGKIWNSTDPMIYVLGAADALELNGIEISDSFIELINLMQEYFFFE